MLSGCVVSVVRVVVNSLQAWLATTWRNLEAGAKGQIPRPATLHGARCQQGCTLCRAIHLPPTLRTTMSLAAHGLLAMAAGRLG